MKGLVENKQIKIKKGLEYVSYTMENPDLFHPSAFRFMKGQVDNRLLQCQKILYNGEITLVYLISEKRPLDTMYGNMNLSAFCLVLSKVIYIMDEVYKNGFLPYTSLDTDFSRIFMDKKGEEVSMILLPVTGADRSIYLFEQEFRHRCVQILQTVPAFKGTSNQRICSWFEDTDCSLEALGRRLFQFSKEEIPIVVNEEGKDKGPSPLSVKLNLISESKGLAPNYYIRKSEYVLGSLPGAVDGLVSDRWVSRVHCKVSFIKGKFYVEDQNSTNGTFINDKRLASGRRRLLKKGDKITLGNASFRVEF